REHLVSGHAVAERSSHSDVVEAAQLAPCQRVEVAIRRSIALSQQPMNEFSASTPSQALGLGDGSVKPRLALLEQVCSVGPQRDGARGGIPRQQWCFWLLAMAGVLRHFEKVGRRLVKSPVASVVE